MTRLTRIANTFAVGMMLFGFLAVAVDAAETDQQSSTSRTVWKHRVLASGSERPAHQQPGWSPYRTGQFGAKVQTVSTSGDAMPLLSGESIVEMDGTIMGDPSYGGGCDSCDSGMACGADGCGDCGGCGDCYECGMFANAIFGAAVHVVTNMDYFAGVHGFKGPTDLGQNGNFGFNYGMNWAAPLGDPWGIGYQMGVGVVHSNFTGDQVINLFSDDHRDQVFFTSGIFRRSMCGGVQWGVVYDLMRDSYRDNATTGQIRTEIALSRPGCRDIGFYGAFGAKSDRMTLPLVDRVITEMDVAPMDIYALFYRRYFTGGGIGRVWAGVTDQGDGLVGADATVPIGTSWALENSFTYMAPKDDGIVGQERESWGVFLRLVWYPGRDAACEITDPYAPLMPVANNTNMLIDAAVR